MPAHTRLTGTVIGTANALRRAAALVLCLALALGPASGGAGSTQDGREAERDALVDLLRAQAASYARDDPTLAVSDRVLEALRRVKRHEFVPAQARPFAYENRPLPIGHGQTISQPYIVALMTELARVAPGDSVLEVGTGSGYQAAVLAALDARVYSIEIIPPLGEEARRRLARLGYHNVTTRIADGYYGWKEHAPFDAIVVTAAATQIPPPLVDQLKPGGVMVIPVGAAFTVQRLVLVRRAEAGGIETQAILPVRFVPLTGGP